MVNLIKFIIKPLGFLMLLIILSGISPQLLHARREHVIYFKDTPYELNVYKILGRKEGPTMMLIGGIQGDEPGGFLSADLYVDLALKRGNLIVVPRANFNSILLFQRGPNGDMNRKFGDSNIKDYDSQIVRILELLMGESDILLNLHDGYGFFRPKYESEIANPSRYGQSIIADCDEFVSPKNGQVLHLRKMAEKAIAEINDQIEDPRYHFHFMNTRTEENDSPYKEQRTSATFYALTRHGIPAFGVETSKNLPTIELKVHQHNLAINSFMKLYGLELEQPRIYLEEPKLDYIVVAINNQVPVAVADGQTLFLDPGDQIEVVHVEANYDRGLSVDIQGQGTINDFHQPFKITKPAFIVAQKDHIKFGRIPIVLKRGSTEPAGTVQPVTSVASERKPEPKKIFRVHSFLIEVNGKQKEILDGGVLNAVDGDTLKIVDIKSEGEPPSDLVVNFKGYVANKSNNTGEDRGFPINTAVDLLPRYSLSKNQKVYEVVVEKGKKVLSKITVRLDEPHLEYVVIQRNDEPETRVSKNDVFEIKSGDYLRVLELKTNIPNNERVHVRVQGNVDQDNDSTTLLSFKATNNHPLTLVITRDNTILGKIVLQNG